MKDSKERQCEEMRKDEMKRKRAEKDCVPVRQWVTSAH